jgi:predicted dehydrogenase
MTSIGIIGCGEMGSTHARCIAELGLGTIRGLCDTDELRARSLAEFAPDAYTTTQSDRLISDGSIDAVYVCTHNESHAGLGIRAARAGKHILMEKPVAMTLSECSDLADAVDRSGVRFMTAFKLRYYPSVARVRSFIPHPFLCVAQMIDERWPDSFWGNDTLRGGGNVLSQGCHAADLMCHLLGETPVSIYARGGNLHHPKLAITDLLTATVSFTNGASASLVIGDVGRTPFLSKLSFQVMDGIRTAHLHDRLRRVHLWDGTQEHTHADSEELGFLEENREFLTALSNSRQPSSSLADGIRATLILLRAQESLKTGQAHSIAL